MVGIYSWPFKPATYKEQLYFAYKHSCLVDKLRAIQDKDLEEVLERKVDPMEIFRQYANNNTFTNNVKNKLKFADILSNLVDVIKDKKTVINLDHRKQALELHDLFDEPGSTNYLQKGLEKRRIWRLHSDVYFWQANDLDKYVKKYNKILEKNYPP